MMIVPQVASLSWNHSIHVYKANTIPHINLNLNWDFKSLHLENIHVEIVSWVSAESRQAVPSNSQSHVIKAPKKKGIPIPDSVFHYCCLMGEMVDNFLLQMAFQLSNKSWWHRICIYCQFIHSLPLCCHPIPQHIPQLFTVWYQMFATPTPPPTLSIPIRNICTLDASKCWLRLRRHALKSQSYPLVSQTPYFRLYIGYPVSSTIQQLALMVDTNFHSPKKMNCAHFNDAVSFSYITTADQPDSLIKIPQLLRGLPGNLVHVYASINRNTFIPWLSL